MLEFLEGIIRYPDSLPCPQADTDLVPRERRYISDITDVRNLRMFQQEFQATRNRISFIFTEEEAREFREWYENDILHGGAWFYADWPTLHKDKNIAHRFVGQPKYEWLLGANPGAMGRSIAGYDPSVAAVTMYKVTAVVEIDDGGGSGRFVGTDEGRIVGKYLDVFTSKLYPYYWEDEMQCGGQTVKAMPSVSFKDTLSRGGAIVASGTIISYIYSSYDMQPDAMQRGGAFITGAVTSGYIYSSYAMEDDAIARSGAAITSGTLENVTGGISYEYYTDAMSRQGQVIISGVTE